MQRPVRFLTLMASLAVRIAVPNNSLHAGTGFGGHLYDRPYETPAVPGPVLGHGGFEENKGQVLTTAGEAATAVRFRLTGDGASVFLLNNGIAYQFNRTHYPEGYAERTLSRDMGRSGAPYASEARPRTETYRMDMILEGASTNARITTEGRSADHANYYGHDALDVHAYTKVVYHDVWPGIDWILHSTQKGLKYDFVVHPGADPDRIRLRSKYHEELHLDAKGRLVHGNRMGRFIEEAPVSFQNGKEIPSRFVLDGNVLRFDVRGYDPAHTLVIDPDRAWSTYHGGPGLDWGRTCAVDPDGNVFLAGETESATGIAEGGYQNEFGGFRDAFLVKYNAAGERLWATYYGGSSPEDNTISCAVDASTAPYSVYLSGSTQSTAGIAENGHQNSLQAGPDAFLVKFNAEGVRQWGTYYGGNGWDNGYACTVDAEGNVYLAGEASSTNGIGFNGHQNARAGYRDGFLVKFNADGVRQWGTFYGSESAGTRGRSCAVDGDGNVFMTGETTTSTDLFFQGHQSVYGGGTYDAFLVKFNSSGARQWATVYGGSGIDWGRACSVDAEGSVYLAGETGSTSGIASGGHQNTYAVGIGDADAFLVKFDADGVRQWGTYYGGGATDGAHACATTSNGDIIMAGGTTSGPLNIASGGFQNTSGGNGDAFLVRFTTSGVRLWGSFYGGNAGDAAYSCATDGDGHVYLAGMTSSASIIASEGHQVTYGGGSMDAFLVKFEDFGTGTGLEESIHTPLAGMLCLPNPTTDQLTLVIGDVVPGQQAMVHDAQGRLVHTQRLAGASTVLRTGHLVPGTYAITVVDPDGRRDHVRFVKE